MYQLLTLSHLQIIQLLQVISAPFCIFKQIVSGHWNNHLVHAQKMHIFVGWKKSNKLISFVQSISKMYMDSAVLVWNGNGKEGSNAIQEFLVQLPRSTHALYTVDCQPFFGNYSNVLFFDLKNDCPSFEKILINLIQANWKIILLYYFTGHSGTDQVTILVTVSGYIRFHTEVKKRRNFNQNFILTALDDKWKIVSDCFRTQESINVWVLLKLMVQIINVKLLCIG